MRRARWQGSVQRPLVPSPAMQMKRHVRASLATVGAVLGVLGGAAAATPALGATYALNLSAPSTTSVGQPIAIQATGVKPPPDQFWYADWIELVAIPTSTVPVCPYGAQDGAQIAANSGGKIIDIALKPNSDAAGNFANTAAYTPPAMGKILICGYMYNEQGDTLTKSADLAVDVSSAGPGPAPPPAAPAGGTGAGPAATPSAPAPTTAKPSNVERPRVSRSGATLTCKPGTWANDPDGYAFGWRVDGAAKRGATGRKLALKGRLRGRKVQCSVTASNAGGTITAVSRAMRVR